VGRFSIQPSSRGSLEGRRYPERSFTQVVQKESWRPSIKKECRMAQAGHIYGKIENKTDLERVFREIRKDVDDAKSRPALTELYKRAGYLITLT
jgi:hypothetical protein